MTLNATPEDRELAPATLDENVDHVPGAPVGGKPSHQSIDQRK
jgi:hypothetical protein